MTGILCGIHRQGTYQKTKRDINVIAHGFGSGLFIDDKNSKLRNYVKLNEVM